MYNNIVLGCFRRNINNTEVWIVDKSRCNMQYFSYQVCVSQLTEQLTCQLYYLLLFMDSSREVIVVTILVLQLVCKKRHYHSVYCRLRKVFNVSYVRVVFL